MEKSKLIRCKAGLASLMVAGSMFLGGCVSNKGFDFKRGEDNSYVVMEGSFINNACIEECYVVEAYNKLTEDTELFIAKKRNDYLDKVNNELIPRDYYLDLLNHNNQLFYRDNSRNNFFVFVKETPLYDYMITLDLIQARYSHEDMERILEEIKAVYEFESEKELVK